MYRRILMPLDGSPCSEHALDTGLGLARLCGASITFLFALETPEDGLEEIPSGLEFYEDLRRMGEEALQRALERAREAGIDASARIAGGTPVEAILDAEEDHDVTVMCTQGRGGFYRFLTGSVTEELLRMSELPHLVLRCPQEG